MGKASRLQDYVSLEHRLVILARLQDCNIKDVWFFNPESLQGVQCCQACAVPLTSLAPPLARIYDVYSFFQSYGEMILAKDGEFFIITNRR